MKKLIIEKNNNFRLSSSDLFSNIKIMYKKNLCIKLLDEVFVLSLYTRNNFKTISYILILKLSSQSCETLEKV